MIFYLSLGSNLGNKVQNIEKGYAGIGEFAKIIEKSSLYKTEPYGYKQQDFFLNSVVKIDTILSAQDLFVRIKELEVKIGRIKRERWRQREIDIDIIEYEGSEISTETLTIPHADYQNRMFVLVPIREIDPEFKNRKNVNIQELLKNCPDKGIVSRYQQD